MPRRINRDQHYTNFGKPRKDYLPSNPTTTGQRIKAARIQASVTQNDLASLLGVSSGLINLWEGDKAPGPRVEQLITMANLFGLPVADLIGEPATDREYTEADLRTLVSVYRALRGYTAASGGKTEGFDLVINWANERLHNGEYDPE